MIRSERYDMDILLIDRSDFDFILELLNKYYYEGCKDHSSSYVEESNRLRNILADEYNGVLSKVKIDEIPF